MSMVPSERPPIQIGLLQRFATEWAYERDVRFWKKGSPTGKRVALVGAGPASLACAHELTKLGHEAVCLEGRPMPGGAERVQVSAPGAAKASISEPEVVTLLSTLLT